MCSFNSDFNVDRAEVFVVVSAIVGVPKLRSFIDTLEVFRQRITTFCCFTSCVCHSFSTHSTSISPRDANNRNAKRKVHSAQPPAFGAENAAQQTVQRADVDVVLRSRTPARRAHQPSSK